MKNKSVHLHFTVALIFLSTSVTKAETLVTAIDQENPKTSAAQFPAAAFFETVDPRVSRMPSLPARIHYEQIAQPRSKTEMAEILSGTWRLQTGCGDRPFRFDEIKDMKYLNGLNRSSVNFSFLPYQTYKRLLVRGIFESSSNTPLRRVDNGGRWEVSATNDGGSFVLKMDGFDPLEMRVMRIKETGEVVLVNTHSDLIQKYGSICGSLSRPTSIFSRVPEA